MFSGYKFNKWKDPIRDIDIVILRYKGSTYGSIANDFNLSSSRIMQICHRVERKIRSALYKNGNSLYEYIYEKHLMSNKNKYIELLKEFKSYAKGQ